MALRFALPLLVLTACAGVRPAEVASPGPEPRDEDGARCADPGPCRPHPFSAEAVRERWKREQRTRDADERREEFIRRNNR